ncbi:hypothetical protein BGZ80_007472, partial [Entomortierella chlamydospora]
YKPVPADIRQHARALIKFYNGAFRDEVTTIAKDKARSEVNRDLFSGKEQLISQGRYKDVLEKDMNNGKGSSSTSTEPCFPTNNALKS